MAWFSLKYYNFKIIDTRALQQKLQVVMRLISAKRCNTFWHFMIILFFFKKPFLDALLLLVESESWAKSAKKGMIYVQILFWR